MTLFKILVFLSLISVSSMTMNCRSLLNIYESPVNDGSPSCCQHSGASLSDKIVMSNQKPCQFFKDLFQNEQCCDGDLDKELVGNYQTCETRRICEVRTALTAPVCNNRICQARS